MNPLQPTTKILSFCMMDLLVSPIPSSVFTVRYLFSRIGHTVAIHRVHCDSKGNGSSIISPVVSETGADLRSSREVELFSIHLNRIQIVGAKDTLSLLCASNRPRLDCFAVFGRLCDCYLIEGRYSGDRKSTRL